MPSENYSGVHHHEFVGLYCRRELACEGRYRDDGNLPNHFYHCVCTHKNFMLSFIQKNTRQTAECFEWQLLLFFYVCSLRATI